MVAFSGLLKDIFGVSGLEIVPNVETYIKSGEVRSLKGRMDLHLGQIIIEFKIDLTKELETAIEEIERYTAILTGNKQRVAACIITDGLKFKVYSVHDKAKEVREIDFRQVTPEQAIMFLDTFLFSERRVPTADDLNMRFGPGSAIYEEIVGELVNLFKGIKDPVKFELWTRNMELVYGSTPPEDAFVSQTYLMVLVRLLLAKRLVKDSLPMKDAVSGRLFNQQGIDIIEDDFFSWVLNPLFWPQVKALLETLATAFDIYDLEAVDEDVFKEIYQEIVRRGDRHKLGEYYTPEWLAELTLSEAIATIDPKNERKSYSILDPACGSGTFLTNAIALLKKKGCCLEEILDNVYGMDLNPLAVTIARANYLLALGKLIEKRKGAIFIPVFMSDSIRLPAVRKELIHGTSILAIDVGPKSQLDLPLHIALDDSELKRVLNVLGDILNAYRSKKLNLNQAVRAFENSYKEGKQVVEVLSRTLRTLIELIDANRDSVWIFMMRNVYAPLRMNKRRFDLVIGNPPWISFKFIENPDYQSFVKETVFKYRLLDAKQTALFTQMDTSTVFYCKTSDIYLSDNGTLAFVMPRSVLTGAKQHEAFKRQAKPQMSIAKIIDVEKVNPLFNVDACSIIARKNDTTSYPVEVTIVEGILPAKNMRLKKAIKFMNIGNAKYSPPTKQRQFSPYHDKVLSGTCLYPRTLWFVKFVSGDFGMSPDVPLVESLILPDAKLPWKNVILKGEIESEFVFLTITGKTLLPFKARFLPTVLPIKRGALNFVILTPEELRKEGKLKIADWLDEAQEEWSRNATKTNLASFPNVMDYVNYHNKLTQQKLNCSYYVVFTASGTHLASAVISNDSLPEISVGKARIKPAGFVPDHKVFYYTTNSRDEAYYLSAILNSNVLDEKIKSTQTRGKFGPRDIHRRPFEYNIPQFNPSNSVHKQLSKCGIKASMEAMSLQKTSRMRIKAAIPSMKEIDKLVLDLLHKQSS